MSAMNRTDVDRLLYGESFELDGRRIDPRRVTAYRDGTIRLDEAHPMTQHDGLGIPPGIGPGDKVEVEWWNGDRCLTFARYVRWEWQLDYRPSNYGRHMSDDVALWRRMPS